MKGGLASSELAKMSEARLRARGANWVSQFTPPNKDVTLPHSVNMLIVVVRNVRILYLLTGLC